MSFLTIPLSWINVGKAIKKELMSLLKDNLDDHETRLVTVESTQTKVDIFDFELGGYLNDYSIAELKSVATYKATRRMNINSFTITMLNSLITTSYKTTAESILVTIKKSKDNGVTWVDTLVYSPILDFTQTATGSTSSQLEWIPDENILEVGEIIRVDVLSKFSNQGSFLVLVTAETL